MPNHTKELLSSREPLGGTGLFEVLTALVSIYSELDSVGSRFASTSRIGCPSGCGSCCVGFDPPVSGPEADLVAAWLMYRGIEIPEPASATCAFFNAVSPAHCGIYPARPLVCRAFGFTSLPDREGRHVFTPCRVLHGTRFTANAPHMDDFGRRVCALSHEDAARMPALSRAVGGLLMKVRMLRRYLAGSALPPPPGG